MKPVCFGENQNIFYEGDDISNIYFLIKGEAGFILPKYDNAIYIKIQEGDHFGIIDIIGSFSNDLMELEEWINKKSRLQRQFTVIAIT